MSKPVKILIAVLAGCILFAVVVFAAAGYWLSRNKEALQGAAADVVEDVERFAEGKSQQDCLDEAFRRAEVCGAWRIICQVENQHFFAVCLEITAPTPGLCDGVPPSDAILESVQYRLAQCPPAKTVKMGNAACGQIHERLQKWCEARPAAELGADT